MRTEVFVFLLLQCFLSKAQQTLPPVGLWRDHLPYTSVIDITAGNEKIYCATPYSVFSINSRENSIERWSRVTGLNETGVSAIYYDNGNDKLLIAYTNSNIDIIHRSDIINIPDIKRSAVVGNKNIYNIYSLQKNYYFSTGLGIIVVDGERYEIKDSWFIGNNGSQVKVNSLISDAGFFYESVLNMPHFASEISRNSFN